jgi:hypothetical protein
MFLKNRLAAFALVIAALSVAAPGIATAASTPAGKPVVTGPSCPADYAGPTNPATGCPYYLMSYTVQYPGGPTLHCPVILSAPAPQAGVPEGCNGVGAPN